MKPTLDDLFMTDPEEIAAAEEEALAWRNKMREEGNALKAKRREPRQPDKYPCPGCGWPGPPEGVTPGHMMPYDCRRYLSAAQKEIDQQHRKRVRLADRIQKSKTAIIKKRLAKLDKRFG